MRIFNTRRQDIPAACRIGYRGYYLSLSTIMTSYGEGAVIDQVGDVVFTFTADVPGILRAKRFIDRRIKAEEKAA